MTSETLLYHYTDAAGVAGIFSTKKVWATYIHALNDSLEESHAFSVIQDYFEERYKRVHTEAIQFEREEIKFNRAKGDDPLEYSGYCNELGTLTKLKKTFKNMDFYYNDHTFTFSLSERRDSLSQWRGYGGKGGYSIGFSHDELSVLCKDNEYRFSKCQYDLIKQREIIKNLLDPFLQSERGGGKHQRYCPSRYDGILIDVLLITKDIRPLFKHESFSEEREWRVIIDTKDTNDFPLCYRPNSPYITPYVELGIDLEVKEVLVGPGVDFYRAKKYLTILAEDGKTLNVDTDKICPSKSSYRI